MIFKALYYLMQSLMCSLVDTLNKLWTDQANSCCHWIVGNDDKLRRNQSCGYSCDPGEETTQSAIGHNWYAWGGCGTWKERLVYRTTGQWQVPPCTLWSFKDDCRLMAFSLRNTWSPAAQFYSPPWGSLRHKYDIFFRCTWSDRNGRAGQWSCSSKGSCILPL